MAVKDVFKVSRKTYFDPRSWLGYDTVKAESNTIWGLIKPVFFPAKIEEVEPENFEDAQKNLNLTNKDVKSIAHTYLWFALTFLIVALVVLAYGFYWLVSGHIFDFILALVITIALLAQAFRYHFWYFQAKHKKLGCTFNEWRKGKPNKEV